MIYFARDPRDGLIKIGSTKDLSRRQVALRSEYFGSHIEIFAVMEGSGIAENALHVKFSHLSVVKRSRVQVAKEWFSPGPDLLAFIASQTGPWGKPVRSRRGHIADPKGYTPTLGGGRKKLSKDDARTKFFQVRMTKSFKNWMKGYLEWSEISLPDAFEAELRAMALEDKYQPPPPEKR